MKALFWLVAVLAAELDGLKNIVNNKEKEILQMDQLINQLNARLQQVNINTIYYLRLENFVRR